MKRKEWTEWLVFGITVVLTFTVFLYGNVVTKNKDFLEDALMDKTNRIYLMDQEVKGLSDKGLKTGNAVFFLVRFSGEVTKTDLQYVKWFTEKLKQRFPMFGVESLATAYDYTEHTVVPYVNDEFLKNGDMRQWKEKIKADPGIYGLLMGKNLNYSLVVMSTLPGYDEMKIFHEVKQFLQVKPISFLDWYLQPDIHPAPEFKQVMPFSWIISRGTMHYAFFLDSFTGTPIGITLATVAFFLFFRSFGQTLISVVVLMIAMWWTRGAIGLAQTMGFEVYERFYFLLVFPTTLVAGISFLSRLIDKYNEMKREFPGEPRWQTWKRARVITSLILTAALVAFINFATLYQIQIMGIWEVGIFSALTIVVLVFLVLFFVPACQTLFGGEAKSQTKGQGRWDSYTAKIAVFCCQAITANGNRKKALARATLGLGLMLSGAVFFVASDLSGLTGNFKYIDVVTKPLEYLENTTDHEVADFLNRPGNIGFDRVSIYIGQKSASAIPAMENPDFLRRSALFIKKAREQIAGVREIKSILDTVEVISRKDYGSSLPKNQQQAHDILVQAEGGLDPITKEQLWHDGGLVLMLFSAADSSKLVRDIRDQALNLADEFPELKVLAFSKLDLYPEEARYVTEGKPINVLTSQWLVILIYAGWIFWRNRRLTKQRGINQPRMYAFRTGVVMNIPFAYATAGIVVAMSLLRIPLDQAIACVTVLAINAASDFGLYPVSDYAEMIENGKSKEEALYEAIAVRGKLVITDILLNCLCFLPLAFSRFLPIARLGKIMIVMLVLCGLGALVIMPVYFEFCIRKPAVKTITE